MDPVRADIRTYRCALIQAAKCFVDPCAVGNSVRGQD